MVGILKYLTLFAVAVCLAFGCEEPATSTRLVKVCVYLDGAVILEGSFSVDGADDADECWRSFQRGTEQKRKWAAFRESENFDEKRLVADKSVADRLMLKANEGERISVSVGYGGIVMVKELALYRYAEKAAAKKKNKRQANRPPRMWILDAKQLDAVFGQRKISDTETARLKTPRKVK